MLLVPEWLDSFIPETAARNQKKEQPGVALVGIQVNVVPLHIGDGVTVLLNTGNGFMVTEMF